MGLFEDMMGSLSGADEAIHPHLTQALQGLIGDEEQPGPGLEGLLAKLQTHGLGGFVEFLAWRRHQPAGDARPVARRAG